MARRDARTRNALKQEGLGGRTYVCMFFKYLCIYVFMYVCIYLFIYSFIYFNHSIALVTHFTHLCVLPAPRGGPASIFTHPRTLMGRECPYLYLPGFVPYQTWAPRLGRCPSTWVSCKAKLGIGGRGRCPSTSVSRQAKLLLQGTRAGAMPVYWCFVPS